MKQGFFLILFLCTGVQAMKKDCQTLKQKAASIVCDYLIRPHTADYKQQPYLLKVLQSSIEKEVKERSWCDIFGDRAQLDYQHKRYDISLASGHVLMVHNLAQENLSEK